MSNLFTEEQVERVSRLFEALGNKTRLKILLMVADSKRPLHIKAVAKTLGMDYAAAYRHVRALEEAGIVEIYEVGRSRVLSLKNQEWLMSLLLKMVEAIPSDKFSQIEQ
ncbi:MAG: winged helix-turn-helix domain-containing protein [Thaumarchaeota archaeon]|jgi:ArsR family transcriptional regulator|nr:winged helix-turn-helix domain-containing protein [Candidatus Terraquivivens yellowstonensis]MCL7400440.1 winged helix-turn-helix domain-containing protein [Candidatus Terraquivivens yellowstonensis]